jgi:sortase A
MIPVMVRALRILSVALITAGIVVLIDAAVTLAWKEPISAVYGHFQQSQAEDELATLERDFRIRTKVEPGLSTERQAAALAAKFADDIGNGDAIGRIEIPSVGIDYVFVEGTDTADLEKGPGHYPDTALPGQDRTIGIAGHRTTYLAPFRSIADIDNGERVTLKMPYGVFTYEVVRTKVVEPTQTEIVDDVGHELLVLTACHPPYSAAQRYAVFARLSGFELEDVPKTGKR